MKHAAKKLYPGRYFYRGRYILQTSWDGPKGGTIWRWEFAKKDRYGDFVIDGDIGFRTLREAKDDLDQELAQHWAVLGYDNLGVTVEKTGKDPEALADVVASWAQQEEDKWPHLGLLYMLVSPADLELV